MLLERLLQCACCGLVAMIGLALVPSAVGEDAPKAVPTADGDVKAGAGDAHMKNDAPGAIEEIKLTPEATRRYGIRIGVAKKRKLTSTLVVPGRVSFNSEAMAVVGSPVQGRVSDVKVRAGDSVSKGDELLVIESPELGEAQSDYLQKRVAATTALSAVEPAKSAFTRAKQLYDQSEGITLTELQKREVEARAAEGALATAQAASTAAENKLHLLGMDDKAVETLVKSSKVNPLYVVRAPLSGQVTERATNLGELVKPEREKLLVVADMTSLWVWADVPESRVRELSRGAKAEVNVGAASEESFPGTVSYIAPTVDPETRTVRVRLEVKEVHLLKPGMFAQVTITPQMSGDSDEAVLAVPDAAVQTVDGSTAVFVPVKGEPNTFRVRLVSVEPVRGGWVQIVAGLDEGERIVTAGTFILKADHGKAGAKDED